MVRRNPHLSELNTSYLFPEINRRKRAYLEKNPHVKLISLGIGDTSQPIPKAIVEALSRQAQALGTEKGYCGYGLEQGSAELRSHINARIYSNQFKPEEIFVSDGALCDIGRLQMLFGGHHRVAIQDPAYPAYVDNSVIIGQTQRTELIRMPCLPENDFFPNFHNLPPIDLIYICSPNNPTGCAATREQLHNLVTYARTNRSIIIFDAAYAIYINDPNLPRSIYEIEGAREVAIEIGSFSKIAGFTGVRLGWSIVPNELCYEDQTPLNKDWFRLVSTSFNGASNISQAGGIAALQDEGWSQVMSLITYYRENAQLIKSTFQSLGYQVYGGDHSPFVWVNIPHQSSWHTFENLLETKGILCVPGSGFGCSGEGFIRLSALGKRPEILEALERLKG